VDLKLNNSKVVYFENLNELITYCGEKTSNNSHHTFIDKNVLLKFPVFEEAGMNMSPLDISEDEKNLATVSSLWNIMFEKSLQRSSIVFSIGGGVISDEVGFAASTYKRGTKLINIPTTLLSMVDAAHGGKNGINNEYGKNQIGTFMMPNEVLICSEFLNELPEKEIKTGLIELIKAGFLKNPQLVEKVYDVNLNQIDTSLISTAVEIKNEIVSKDFAESSERMLLNFGHTIGHLIEVDSNYNISHGEAVAVGMLKSMKISENIFGLDSNVAEKFGFFLEKLELHKDYKFNSDTDLLKELLINDKKTNNTEIKYVLLKDIGEPILIDYDLMELLNEITND